MRKFLRWAVLIVSLVLGTTGLSLMISGLAGHALSPVDRPDNTALVLFYVGLVLFALAFVLGMLTFPSFTAIGGLCLVPIVVLGGASLAITAMVLGRADPIDIDGSRAARDTWLGAALCFVVAIALAVNFALWLRRGGSQVAFRHLLHVAAVGYGSILFLSGLAGMVSVVTGLFGAGDVQSKSLYRAVLLVGSMVLATGPGAILLWHGAGALTRVSSTRFRPPPLWLPLLASAGAIGLGAVMLQSGTATSLMPLTHGVAMLAPGLALIALASMESRRAGAAEGSTWREVLLMIAYGAGVAATIAGIVNTFSLVASFIVYLTANGAFDGIQTFGDFSDALRNTVDDLGKGGLIALTLLVVAVVAPFNEEFWKGFGVRLLKSHHPTRYRAFLWGLSSGVGFGMVEANQYSLSAFARSPYRWWDTMLLRGATSSLHALASGIVGVAWFYAFAGRRLRFLGLYLLAVGLHGSWNAVNVLTTVRVLPWFRTFSDHNLEIVLEVLIGLLTVPIWLFLRLFSRSLADEEQGPPSEPAPPLPGESEGRTPFESPGSSLAATPSTP